MSFLFSNDQNRYFNLKGIEDGSKLYYSDFLNSRCVAS